METLVEVKKRDGQNQVLVFDFSGELDETNADKTFTQIYEMVGDFSKKKVIFNLTGLKYLNSKSIGYIADIFSNLEDKDGKMSICSCQDGVKDVLELVGITTIIPTFDTEQEAYTAL